MEIELFPYKHITLRPFIFEIKETRSSYVDFFVSEEEAVEITKSLREGVIIKYILLNEDDEEELYQEVDFPKDIRDEAITDERDPNINEVIITIIEAFKDSIPDRDYDYFFFHPEEIIINSAILDTERREIIVTIFYDEDRLNTEENGK